MNEPLVSQATTFKAYTPSTAVVPYEYCAFYLTADCNVELTDKDGNYTASVAMYKGYQPILVSKIHSISAGAVYLCKHNKVGA